MTEALQPTMNLRVLKKHSEQKMILQQWWAPYGYRHSEVGEWRDIPIESE